MWLERVLTRLRPQPGTTLIRADWTWGIPHIFYGLRACRERLVWIDLDRSAAGNPVAVGDTLVRALETLPGLSPLGRYGGPWQYALDHAEAYLDLLRPYTIAVSGAEHAPDLAEALHHLVRRSRAQLVLQVDGTGLLQELGDSVTLGPEDISLTLDEAYLMAGVLDQAKVQSLWRDSRGAYELFRQALARRYGLPQPWVPTPSGWATPGGVVDDPSHSQVFELLLEQHCYEQALELAALHLPERVPEVITPAAHRMHAQGLHHKLLALLERLPKAIREQEECLFWRLAASVRVGRHRLVREEVEVYLNERAAPELRALYAGTLAPIDRFVPLVQEAVEARRTPFTLYQLGKALEVQDPEAAEEVLRKALALAEEEGEPYEVVRNAEGLGVALLGLGKYVEGARILDWALHEADKIPLGDVYRRLALLNNWGYARVLVGELKGLERLCEAEHSLASAGGIPDLSRLMRSTLAALCLARGEGDRALEYAAANWEAASRPRRGPEGNNLVRALLEVGQFERAKEVGEAAYSLARGTHPVYERRGLLAYGMALALKDPRRALPLLEQSVNAMGSPLLAYRQAQAMLYLANAHLHLGDEEQARATLERAAPRLAELSDSGLRALAGPPEAFDRLRSLIRGGERVELRLLGKAEVWMGSRRIPLPLRRLEILALLAMYPQGLTAERLILLLQGDEGNLSTLKAHVSYLRESVPVGTRPYRITVPFESDWGKVSQLIRQGNLREALALYGGSLLPSSEAPGIVSARAELEEMLRRAVLAARDPELLMLLAERVEDDLELWEALLEVLLPQDPARPRAEACAAQIRRSYGL